MTDLVTIARDLQSDLADLVFTDPVSHVYDPLDYAWEPHRRYLERWGAGTKEVVLVGMNPGPFGMGQTGVPFGAVPPVRDWLGVAAPVGRPPREHPKRPVEGFDHAREEVSGMRLWGWAAERFGTPGRFFERFFVHNYCPLLFLGATGRNLTPDKLRAAERDAMLPACDRALRRTLEALRPRWVLGVGVWAEGRVRAVLGGDEARDGEVLRIGRILHPSPASPAANRGWAEAAERQLAKLGIALPA